MDAVLASLAVQNLRITDFPVAWVSKYRDRSGPSFWPLLHNRDVVENNGSKENLRDLQDACRVIWASWSRASMLRSAGDPVPYRIQTGCEETTMDKNIATQCSAETKMLTGT